MYVDSAEFQTFQTLKTYNETGQKHPDDIHCVKSQITKLQTIQYTQEMFPLLLIVHIQYILCLQWRSLGTFDDGQVHKKIPFLWLFVL